MSTTTRRRKRKEKRAQEKIREKRIDKGPGFFTGMAECECCEIERMYFKSDASARKALEKALNKFDKRNRGILAYITDDNGEGHFFIAFYGIWRDE